MSGHFVCAHAHTHTTNILSYSFSHSVELPLGFTGVVLYLHHLCETVIFTRNTLDTVWMTFQFISAKAVPAHYFVFFSCMLSFIRFCMWLCIQFQTHLSPKVWPTTFHNASSFYKNCAAPWSSRTVSNRPHSLWRKMSLFRFLVQSVVCNLVRLWLDFRLLFLGEN